MAKKTPSTITPPDYEYLLGQLAIQHQQGQLQAYQSVNTVMLTTYWQMGQYIVEYEQHGKDRATYGQQLIKQLSKDLTLRLGKGYSQSQLVYIRLFYIRYPNSVTLSHQLSWSHYYELLKIVDSLEREFYEKQTVREHWNVRELRRQKDSALFLRLALSKDKKGILELAKQGQQLIHPRDVVRDTYVLEFLNLPVHKRLTERRLEKKLMEHLQTFLLELGKGFTFVGQQYAVPIEGTTYKVDLVFYHRFLRCFVLIDLKVRKVRHQDIGQMNMYMGYFANEENAEGDGPPIGIILTREKNDLLVKYATYGMDSQLFVSKYQLYLPDADQFRRAIEPLLNDNTEPINDND